MGGKRKGNYGKITGFPFSTAQAATSKNADKISVTCLTVLVIEGFIFLYSYFRFPQLRSRNPRERPKVLTDKHTRRDSDYIALAIAIGTSKYYLPKVLRPLPTYLLLT
jgi:hypothetical protein